MRIQWALGGLTTIFPFCLRALSPALLLAAEGLVGNDPAGDYALLELEKADISTRFFARHPTLGTSFTDMMSVQGGERTFFHYCGGYVRGWIASGRAMGMYSW